MLAIHSLQTPRRSDLGPPGKRAGVKADAESRAREAAENASAFRNANERMIALAAANRFDRRQRVPFVCECSDPSCREIVMASSEDYERIRAHPSRFLLAAGHEDPDSSYERIIEAEQGYAVVEKFGAAGAEAARLHPRARGHGRPSSRE